MAGQGDVDEFVRLSVEIVQMAIDYASANEWSEQADANIRKLRISTIVLLSALQQASVVRPPASPPEPEPVLGAVGATEQRQGGSRR